MGIIYGLKVNLSVAIVSMVNHTALDIISNDQQQISLKNNQPPEPIEGECFHDSNSTGPIEVSLYVYKIDNLRHIRNLLRL